MCLKQEYNIKGESRKLNTVLIQKPYSIEAPSMEDNHTVKSPPQVVYFTSDTRQRIGDDSISAQDKSQNKEVNRMVILYDIMHNAILNNHKQNRRS